MNKFLLGLLREKTELEEKRKALKERALQHRDNADELRKVQTDLEGLEREMTDLNGKIEVERTRALEEEANNRMNAYLQNPVARSEEHKYLVRTALARMVRGERPTEEEEKAYNRAMGAVTTTSKDFTAPTSSVQGINNGGIFIPTEIVLDILKEESLASPIYRDVVTTAIPELVQFPYKKSRSGAKNKKELEESEAESIEWALLSGKTGNYTDTIAITFEMQAMAIDEFTPYLIGLLAEGMRELLVQDYIYGTGEGDKVLGLTKGEGTVVVEYSAANKTKYAKNLEEAIKKLPLRKRAGSKIYLASDLYDGLMFEKDSNGDYILPILNGVSTLKFAPYAVEMDPYLKPGEGLIGNIGKWYKANIYKPMTIGLDTSNKKRLNEYTAHAMISAVPVPGSFVHMKLSTTLPASGGGETK